MDETSRAWLFDGENLKAASFNEMLILPNRATPTNVQKAKRDLAQGILKVSQLENGQAILSNAFARLTALDPMLDELKEAREALEESIEREI